MPRVPVPPLLRVIPRRTAAVWLAVLALSALLAPPASRHALAADCPAPGEWQRDGDEALSSAAMLSELAKHDVVLLGEQHDRLAHHRWQLHTLAGLHAHRAKMVIGLEMLPREAQPALDAWVAGELDEAAFLEASDWDQAWGFDPALYLPILHFARMQQIPLRSLNVTPELRRRLVDVQWALPASERFGISVPADPEPAYRDRLAKAYAEHAGSGDDPEGLERFIAAQLVWDRAMASGLAEARDQDILVVGLMGSGHLVNGHGVPHQLDDLGVRDHQSLMPWDASEGCRPPRGQADAVYVLGDERDHEHSQRLGVVVEPSDAPAAEDLR